MIENTSLKTLDTEGLRQFLALQGEAIGTVTERFYASHGALYARFGSRGREACSEDLAFHLEFLRPVLEFGLLQPMIDYLRWLHHVLVARAVPHEHLALSLDWLAEFFAEQMDSHIADIVVSALSAAKRGYQANVNTPLFPPVSKQPWPEAAAFESALLAGDHNAAQHVISDCMARDHSLIDVELHVIQPALYAIGEKWQSNQVSVAQEHLATAIAQSLMTVSLQHAHPLPSVDKRVLLACVEGNQHAVGLQMVADAFLLSGWTVHYLGANVPTKALIEHTTSWQPDLIGLSVSFPQQIRTAKRVIIELSEHFGEHRPAVMIGGLAFNRFNGLVGVVGADSFGSDAESAVEVANRMLR